MRKRENTLDASLLLNGVSYGEHVMNPDSIQEDIKQLTQGYANTFVVRCNPEKPLTEQTWCELAEYAVKENLHFGILYAYQFPPKGKKSHLNAELVAKLETIAGDLFIGEIFGEAGSDKAAKDVGYYVEGSEVIALQMPPQNFQDMHAAKENYVRFIRKMTDYDREIGLEKTMLVEATALSRYNLEGGIRTPVLEVLPGDPEILTAFTRGAAIGYRRKNWGGFIACEWYGGYRHEDALKKARLDLTYRYLYLSGANLTFLESGSHEIKSFGYDLDESSELCEGYRTSLRNFQKFISGHPRPSCGPLAKVAFLAGADDGYTEFMGGSSWCQFGREAWGKDHAERSWDILKEVYRSRDWHDPASFARGDLDLNQAPAYGSYDVLPVESPSDVFKAYDYLIFAGWNTMTEDLYEKLTAYVKNGGVLFACAAHLSENPSREGKRKYVKGGDWSELFGCVVQGEDRKNNGVKFTRDSFIKNLYYPGTSNLTCDANYPSGFADYARVRMTGGQVRCMFADSFFPPQEPYFPVVVENRAGSGVAILLTAADYPGHPAVYPVYRQVVKGLLAASHADSDLKVSGSDKVRFSVFYNDGGDDETLVLLNTAFGVRSEVLVLYRGLKMNFLLDPLELRIVSLDTF